MKSFKPEDPARNHFTMTGQHRLCVTMEDLKFFPIGTIDPISFPIVTLRSCVCNDRFFQLNTGRSSFSGAGTLLIYCDDKDISSNLNRAVSLFRNKIFLWIHEVDPQSRPVMITIFTHVRPNFSKSRKTKQYFKCK